MEAPLVFLLVFYQIGSGHCVNERMQVDTDSRSTKLSDSNITKFRSYLGLIARQHVSIVISSCDEVEEIKEKPIVTGYLSIAPFYVKFYMF